MEDPKVRLRYKDRDTLFKKEFSELKIKVTLNWFELIVLNIVSFFISFKLVLYFQWSGMIVSGIIALVVTAAITCLFSRFRKYQLKITRFDKEHIYTKISNDLLDKTKK